MSTYKLLSLFDGSGGFPLAASLCGIKPVYASEVEPYPIAVTRSRFPNMKHLGSVTDIHGGDIEPVDIITFGSPCQDLSIAGKRAGLKHTENGDEETTRSGLFMEAVRIIKEMREATNGEYPSFALWENVPGAFSSNKGEDFRIVLEELIKIVEPEATVPPLSPGEKWPYYDCYMGDGWSLAYRTYDAQWWGVPQRRRRIYLVLDLRGQRAGQISFERKGVRGHFETFKTAGEGTAGDAADRAGADDCEGAIPYTLKIRSGCEGGGKGALIQEDMSATLATNNDQYLFQPVATFQNTGQGWWNESGVGTTLRTPCGGDATFANVAVQTVDGNILDDQGGQQITVRTDGKAPTLRAETHGNLPCVLEAAGFKAGNGAKARGIGWQEEISPTLAAAQSGTNQAPTVCIKEQYLFENHSQDSRYKGPLDVCPMLPAQLGTGGNNQPFVVEETPLCMATQQGGAEIMENLCPTITASAGMSGNNQPVVCMAHGQANAEILEDVCPCLNCNHEQPIVAGVDCRNLTEHPELYPTLQAKPNGGQSLNYSGAVRIEYIVRRLTPTECARLQGFPSVVEVDMTDITRDELAAIALSSGYIKVDVETGKVYGTRGPGGTERKNPIELYGSNVNGYIVHSIHAAGIKKQIRAHRLVWIAAHGAIPDGMIIDHINNDKSDNRICNLQLLTPEQNSTKAREDGRYQMGENHPKTKISEQGKRALYFLYWNTNKPYSHYARMFGISDSRAQQIIHERQWADTDPKEDFTDEEYRFWLDVRNTHAAINGKPTKDYTKNQMLTWYNKLHTDSAEYKMWGNGIALPTALYVMQGIMDALDRKD